MKAPPVSWPGIFSVWLLCAFALPGAEAVKKPTVVLISGEYEYKSAETLPAFKKYLEANYPVTCVYLVRTGEKENDIPGLEALAKADLALFFIRRMTLPEDQLAKVRAYASSGRPIIGVRTASHAFENWKEWDHDVLGGNYQNHHGNKISGTARVIPDAAGHPILAGVSGEFPLGGSLYRNAPLPEGSTPLLTGTISGKPAEPIAWTHTYKNSRVFYTSLGHPDDFANPAFQRLLVNAIYWGLNQPVPARAGPTAIRKVGVEEFDRLRQDQGSLILDVRTAEEYQAGHLEGAINLDVTEPDFARKISGLDKGKTYLVHCAAGRRSASACSKMAAAGFTSLIDLESGMNGWKSAGKPIVRPGDK